MVENFPQHLPSYTLFEKIGVNCGTSLCGLKSYPHGTGVRMVMDPNINQLEYFKFMYRNQMDEHNLNELPGLLHQFDSGLVAHLIGERPFRNLNL